MTAHRRSIIGALIVTTVVAGGVHAQDKAVSPPPPAPTGPPIPVRVQIVISRHQGAKEISRLPYTVALNANDPARAALRMGAQVPIRTTTFTPVAAGGKPQPPASPMSSFSYRDVGTNIDCGPITMVDGRFRVTIAIEDSSVYTAPEAAGAAEMPRLPDAPAFRSFRTSTTLSLKDGETTQFTAATDRVNGEVVRVEVTLTATR